MTRVLLFIVLSFFSLSAYADEKPLSRILIALYDSREESSPRTTQIHRFLEMPANYLGFDVQYQDINAPLPVLGDDVRGIIAWFNSGNEVPDAELYLNWLDSSLKAGKKLIILENAGIGDKYRKDNDVMQHFNQVLSKIGVQDSNNWNAVTYQARMAYIDKSIAGFERQIGPVLPPFGDTHIIPGKAMSHLQMNLKDGPDANVVDLITTSPQGGYVAEGYAIFYVVENEESKISQWFVNPFIFLQRSLGVTQFPIPDITTYYGKRVFYSHIDGDGWNNISEIPKYNEEKVIAADVIKREVLMPYNDFAFTVGLITADVDPECYGERDSERVAREIFALPNVEPSSHTHTHPLYWAFFANYSPEKEQPLLGKYPIKPKQRHSMYEDLKEKTTGDSWKASAILNPDLTKQGVDAPIKPGRNDDTEAEVLRKYYPTPRSYACKAFDLNDEITGSMAEVNALAPAGKKARLIQWPGDTSPFEAALAKTREAGYLNINGGDSRFDNEYPSYSSVAPIGLKVGKERQIYSSNSNENTYTNLWTGRFFGFRYLQTTVLNTEKPIRVRPFNIYFHMYSGQKQASLNAVRENLDFARTQDIIPITASDFASIANGFYSTQIIPITENRWRIENRGDLQTLRFDHALDKSVDFNASEGVIGQIYFEDYLYILLNSASQSPIIQLKNNNNAGKLPVETLPYLTASTWPIKALHNNESLLTIQTSGFGQGKMSWMMPKSGDYLIKAAEMGENKAPLFEKRVSTSKDGLLLYTIDVTTPQVPLVVTIERIEK